MNNVLTIKRARITVFMLIFAILILYGIKLYIEQSYTTQGIQLGNLQAQIQKLSVQNDLLRAEILTNESFATIAQKASEEGFVQQNGQVLIIK